jgi:hypothetical protein
MRLQLIVEVDATEDECEEVLDQLAEAVEERALLMLGSGGDVQLVAFNEVAPLGRPHKTRPQGGHDG